MNDRTRTAGPRAIPTAYKGIHFRSRLEARWAVFFTYAEIPWQYEPQGYILEDDTPYLPDFLLTDSGTWVEVKGHPSQVSEEFLYAAAEALPHIPGLGEGCEGLMLLTEIPDVTLSDADYSWPVYSVDRDNPFDLAGGVRACRASDHGFGSYHKNRRPWFHDNSGYPDKDDLPYRSVSEQMDERIRLAYKAARAARFEHGERP